MKYYLLRNTEDGTYFEEFAGAAELQKELDELTEDVSPEHLPVFSDSLPRAIGVENWPVVTIVIKGEIVKPRGIMTVSRFEVD